MPVARTVPGAFLDLVLGAVETDFAPPELMALLKHPAGAAGAAPERRLATRRGRWNAAPSATSMSARGSPARATALEAAGTEETRPLRALSDESPAAARRLVADLEAAFCAADGA